MAYVSYVVNLMTVTLPPAKCQPSAGWRPMWRILTDIDNVLCGCMCEHVISRHVYRHQHGWRMAYIISNASNAQQQRSAISPACK